MASKHSATKNKRRNRKGKEGNRRKRKLRREGTTKSKKALFGD